MGYDKTSPKNKKKSGTVGSTYKETGTEQGDHSFVVKKIVDASWSKTECIVGEEIDANVETSGYKDGTEITFKIYEKDSNSPDMFRGTAKKKLSGNKASFTFKYPEGLIPKKNGSTQYSAASIYFIVLSHSETLSSGAIPLYSDLNIKVEKEDGTALSQVAMILNQSDGKITPHTTDSSGKISIEKLPPRNHKIKFPGSSRIVPEGLTTFDFDAALTERSIVAMGKKVHVFKLIELYYYCSHKIDGKRRSAMNSRVFEVVPESIGKDAYTDEVMILSRTATALQSNGAKLEKKEEEFGMHAFLLKCEQESNFIPKIWTLDFWKGLAVPKEYPISGLPTSLSVKCYRPDLYKMQIKFPPFRKWSGGSKVESEKEVFLNESKNKRPHTSSHWEYKKEKEGWHTGKCPMPLTSEAPIILLRNGTQITLGFMESVGAVIKLGNQLSMILSLIQKNVPKVGWYFEWENQLFQGTFVVEWGWKEYKDHRAYYYVGMNIDLKLIELKLEIGIGVSGFSYKVQIFGSLTGGVTLSIKTCRYSPDGDQEFSFPFGAEIVGALGARAQVGCFVKMEGTVETGIKLEDGALKFRAKEGWSAGFNLKWSGITGKLKISAGTAKKEGVDENSAKEKKEDFGNEPKEQSEKMSSTYEHELIGSSDLGKWQWPDTKAEYNPPVIPHEDLHKMLVKKLTEGDNIRVKTSDGWVLNKYMDMEEVAKAIETKIHARNDIRKDPQTAEALVFDIRNRLEQIIHEIDSGTHFANMDKQRFELFLKGGELKRRLDKYIDPMQEIINKNP